MNHLKLTRRASTLARACGVGAGVAMAVGLTVVPPANADDTPPPQVASDQISLYSGETGRIDVLSNDAQTVGGDLALCRFPDPSAIDPDFSSVYAYHDPSRGPGNVTVNVNPLAPDDTAVEVDYYVCDHVHLTPATLTIQIRDVQPVTVEKLHRPGDVRVINDNDAPISWWFGARHARRPDGKVSVPAHGQRVVHVERRNFVWVAFIGDGGRADQGTVSGIHLTGAARHTDRPPSRAGGHRALRDSQGSVGRRIAWDRVTRVVPATPGFGQDER